MDKITELLNKYELDKFDAGCLYNSQELKENLIKDLKEAINYTHCCNEFFCSGEESEYKKCNEQCGGCEDIEQARKTK